MDEAENSIVELSCTLDHFSDRSEVTQLLESADDVYKSAKDSERILGKLKVILDKYLQQPHLLDPYLEELLNNIVYKIKDKDCCMELKHLLFKCMFLIINVRGHKAVIRVLPHEVSDLEPVLQLIEQQDEHDNTNWETRYCLLLWLSIIVMIPFNMDRLDCALAVGSEDKKTAAGRIFGVCQKYLVAGDKSRDAAAVLCARFVSRVDTKDKYLPRAIQWASNELPSNGRTFPWMKFGPLTALAYILKHCKREDIKPYTRGILEFIVNTKCLSDSYRLTRKYAIKIVQRIALSWLPVKVASWRYTRGSRSLMQNLKSTTNNGINPQAKNSIHLDEEDDDYEVPPIVEEVISSLLDALQDADITARWSAAKGVGRVTSRLPLNLGDDIVDSVLTLFDPRENCCAWNGACFALAELGRRGLLLPDRLPKVIEVLLKSLVYEDPRGVVSTGVFVRDSACYTSWSLARAYDPEVLKPFVAKLAGGLLIVACYDREVNCRRAASAAFQEHVGRQGTFPRGIDIVTVADYFSIGARKNAYLNVSTFVAQFPEYRYQLIDHLVGIKTDHWDLEVRDVTAQTLHKMAVLDPKYIKEALHKILPKVDSPNVNICHGALLTIGEIVHALSMLPDPENRLDKGLVEKISSIIPKYIEEQKFRGVKGDLVKESCCHLIVKCSNGKLPLNEDVIDCWHFLIDHCLPYESAKVRTSAATALSSFAEEYYTKDESRIEAFDSLLTKYLRELVSSVETARDGYAIAFGLLPRVLLEKKLPETIRALTQNTVITEETKSWASSRKEAVETLSAIWKRFYDERDKTSVDCLQYSVPLLETFLSTIVDYTVDKRGDIGSHVREASIKSMQIIVTNSYNADKSSIPVSLLENVLAAIAKQAVERLNRVRYAACLVFIDIVTSDIPEFLNMKEVKDIVLSNDIKEINWNNEGDTFPIFVKLLKYPGFSKSVLTGLIRCIGGVTESLVKSSISAISGYLAGSDEEEVRKFCDIVVEQCKAHIQDENYTKSVLMFIEKLLALAVLKPVIQDGSNPFAGEMYALVRKEVIGSKNTNKLLISVDVFCQLLQAGGKVAKSSLSTLCVLLAHRYTWLRKTVALHLSEAMMMYTAECGVSPENEDKVIDLLTTYDWENPSVDEIRKVRNDLCALLNIPAPVVSPKAQTS